MRDDVEVGPLVYYEVPVADIVTRWNPFKAWGVGRITADDVLAMSDIDILRYCGNVPIEMKAPFPPVSKGKERASRVNERLRHVARIAWLVRNRDATPIEVEVGCPSIGGFTHFAQMGGCEVSDGNHRLAAAVIRGDNRIVVSPGGELDYFEELFPQAIECFNPEVGEKPVFQFA